MKLRRRGKVYFLDATVDNHRIRESLETEDRTVASMRAKIRLRELAGPQTVKDPTVDEFREEYLEYSRAHASVGEVNNRRSALKRLSKEFPGLKLSELSPKIADLFTARLLKPTGKKTIVRRGKSIEVDVPPVSPGGVNSYVRTLRSALNIALRWKYASVNPFAGIPRMFVQSEPPKVLSRKEIAALMMMTKNHYPEMLDLFNFALVTGLRRSEIVRLQWEDVDLERNILIIRGKRKKLRYVPMLKKARAILESRRIFVRPFIFTADKVTDKFGKVRAMAGVDATFHDFRRAFASYCLSCGISREVVQKILGHESFSTTDEFYFGIKPELIERFAAMEDDFSAN
jgi:integrase